MEVEKSKSHQQFIIKNTLDQYDYLDTQQKAFIKRTAEGTLERFIQLDYIINLYSNTKTEKMEPFIRALLRMSTYQIMFMKGVPDSAAVNEAVNLCHKFRFADLKGFVNAVLRNIARSKAEIEWPDKSGEGGESYYLSIMYSMPLWICKMWLEDYGYEKTEKMLKFFYKPRPTYIRIDERMSLQESVELIEELSKANDGTIKISENSLLSYAYSLVGTDNIRYLPGFKEGHWIVQDPSSMLVTEVADIQHDQIILDVCAAPGGKALHAAAKMENTGKVYARDISMNKCKRISENVRRMKAENVVVEQFDATVFDEKMVGNVDVLYCDLPCSGLGIIGRKPDIKYNLKPGDLKSLQETQKKILKTVWTYVKPGGILVYSTCTVNKGENEEMVKWIENNLHMSPVDITPNVPEQLKHIPTLVDGYVQLLPGQFGTDGFFISKFVRE
ncbi:MAG: 16S rRNA (cytosine(967)-C(5))-methyltransferase RsmB [Butyrivibrio sp.]|nr:16S rRNA (cytosine(967)-C(5))-methyltransferase RsmB [Butyrivibrio sp.]